MTQQDELETRVLACFATVFPDVPKPDLGRATQASIAGWDSVAHVTLLAVLAEEFRFELDYEAGQEMLSFALAIDYVRDRVRA